MPAKRRERGQEIRWTDRLVREGAARYSALLIGPRNPSTLAGLALLSLVLARVQDNQKESGALAGGEL